MNHVDKKSLEFQETLHSPTMRLILLCVLVLMAITGCGTQREESSHAVTVDQSTTKVTETATKTIPGPDGPIVAEVVQTVRIEEHIGRGEVNGTSQAATTIQAPAIIENVTKLVGTAVKAAEGATPWGTITGVVGGLITAALGAFAASQKSKAAASDKRAEEHKADAEEGWAKALETRPTPPPQG